MYIKKIILLGLLSAVFCGASAQKEETGELQRLPDGVKRSVYQIRKPDGKNFDKMRIEPLNWWVGMKNPNLELLIYDKDIKGSQVKISHPGVTISKVITAENPNYLFVQVKIAATTKPGTFDIVLTKNAKSKKYPYTLLARDKSVKAQGLKTSDFVYMLMPDRFANGDASNDSNKDMKQQGIDRSKLFFRHGGDIKGITDHFDYFHDLGVTAIWPNPLLENDEYYESYHGYAVTDLYHIDRRFGDNALYKKMVTDCHQNNIKVIKDIIHNHVGENHWFVRDIPTPDWIHQQDTFTRTSYRDDVIYDPYASKSDKSKMSDGWFDLHMPDLNQNNERLAVYLIQNNIWWVEYSGLDGYRLDTYFYPDVTFMARWAKAMREEYPNLTIFGETWVQSVANQAYFTDQNNIKNSPRSYMPGVTDFQVHFSMVEALTKPQGWTDGVTRLYRTLASDYLYKDPTRNIIFLDNHDISRIYSVVGENPEKLKSGIALLLTMRGIPQIYYGTELAMTGLTNPDGYVRQDFPGGWKEDKVNKFVASGRSDFENDIYNYVSKLAKYRAANPTLYNGKLMQFIPEEGVYVYFRYDAKKAIMVVYNSSEKQQQLSTSRFKERTGDKKSGINIITGEDVNLAEKISLDPYQTKVIELN